MPTSQAEITEVEGGWASPTSPFPHYCPGLASGRTMPIVDTPISGMPREI